MNTEKVIFTNDKKAALKTQKQSTNNYYELMAFNFRGYLNAPDYLPFDYVVCTWAEYRKLESEFGYQDIHSSLFNKDR